MKERRGIAKVQASKAAPSWASGEVNRPLRPLERSPSGPKAVASALTSAQSASGMPGRRGTSSTGFTTLLSRPGPSEDRIKNAGGRKRGHESLDSESAHSEVSRRDPSPDSLGTYQMGASSASLGAQDRGKQGLKERKKHESLQGEKTKLQEKLDFVEKRPKLPEIVKTDEGNFIIVDSLAIKLQPLEEVRPGDRNTVSRYGRNEVGSAKKNSSDSSQYLRAPETGKTTSVQSSYPDHETENRKLREALQRMILERIKHLQYFTVSIRRSLIEIDSKLRPQQYDGMSRPDSDQSKFPWGAKLEYPKVEIGNATMEKLEFEEEMFVATVDAYKKALVLQRQTG
jgi:hypothetical protein